MAKFGKSILPGILVFALVLSPAVLASEPDPAGSLPIVADGEENRVHFRKLRQLLVDIDRERIDNVSMDVLSMGMSGDYLAAVKEGASVVRVGTGIFGARDYGQRP